MLLNQCITVLIRSSVGSPVGKLKVGKVYELEDSPYVRVLIKSGTVDLVDPPSLEPEFLEKAGYELKEGYSYPEKKEPEKEVEQVGRMKVKKLKEPESKESVSKEPESEEPVSAGPYLIDGPVDPTDPEAQVYYGVHSSPESRDEENKGNTK